MQRNLLHRALFKFNGDFGLYNTDEDGCTVKTCLVNKGKL